jgi:hypothetical protein
MELHIPLVAAPKEGTGKVEKLVATVHLFLRNEW